ncbi:MAG TPA: PQQ-binding-like beta-propeller repeat protein [Ideonella sp.]|nr:PQQ-binding-like beta-propeller repeat protein [Ideonella sp.]
MLLSAAPLQPALAAAGQWTQEGRDAGATSSNPGETVLQAGNLTQLRPLWSGNLDVWNQATDIAAANGHAFIGRRVDDPVTTVRMQLLSLDLGSGTLEWQADVPDFFWTPVVTRELVIVAGNGLGETGSRVRVAAYDRSSGAKRWEYRTPAGSHVDGFRAPHLQGGVLYLVSGNGHLHALDAATGALRWTRWTGSTQAHHGLAVAGSRLFVSDYHGTSAYDTGDGHPLWRYDLQIFFQTQTQRPLVVEGSVLLFDYAGGLRAINAATGALRWYTATPRGDMASGSRPLATDGQRVFAANGVTRSQLSALDLETGKLLWTVNAGQGARSPVVANGVLYLPAATLKAYGTDTGAALPIARLRPSRNSEVIVVDGKLLTSAGPVMAFGLPPAGER